MGRKGCEFDGKGTYSLSVDGGRGGIEHPEALGVIDGSILDAAEEE